MALNTIGTSPNSADAGAEITDASGNVLLDPVTNAPLTSEGLGIANGRITKYLQAGIETVAGQDFSLHSRDSAQLVVTISDVDGSAFDASQATISWTAGKPGATPIVSKSSESSDQIRKPDKANSVIIVYLRTDDTGIPAGADLGVFYQHELKITTVDQQTITAMTGVMTLIRALS